MKIVLKTIKSSVYYFVLVMTLFVTPMFASEGQTFSGYDSDVFPEEYCMALNIYYEARGSSFADQVAVADVVLNRVQDTRYPNTVCSVVRQGKKNADGSMKRNACQFSWYCDGKSDWPRDTDAWVSAQTTAWRIIKFKEFRGITEGATHYHADYVNPRWARTLTLTGTIGVHKFYRWD
jgi:spore germination cell wall hydrolase CwlJ-like protein